MQQMVSARDLDHKWLFHHTIYQFGLIVLESSPGVKD